MATLAGLLAVTCLSVAGFHLLRLVVVRADPLNEASHAAMGVGMAAMFSPVGDPVPAPVWVGVFALCGVGSAAVALRSPAGLRRTESVHHVVGGAAMAFMLLGGHRGGGAASLAAIVLAGYFGWHVLRCGDRLHAAHAPTAGAVTVRARPLRDARVVATAHVVMAAATAVMLLGMV